MSKIPDSENIDEYSDKLIEFIKYAQGKSQEIIDSKSLALANWYLCKCLHLKWWHINGNCLLCLQKKLIQCKGFNPSINLRINFARLEELNGNSRE